MQDVPADLPGHELVSAGLTDLTAGRESESALIVAMAAPRLRALGYDVPSSGYKRPSHRLYELLTEDGHDAQGTHSRYNALVRRIVSFARAAERVASRARDAERAAPQAPGRASSRASTRVLRGDRA